MKNILRAKRNEVKLTQAELSEEVGVSRHTIHAIEIGRFMPSIGLALVIANFFELQVEDLFILEESDY